jgi:hypothetical protein
MLNEFPFLTSRLSSIKLYSDHLRNFEVLICLYEFESYVYGVVSQYSRIIDNQQKTISTTSLGISLTQLRLDIYYYTLTWDKLRKVFDKLKGQINDILRLPNTLPGEFINDYKLIRNRMDHLFGEFRTTVRNEYEHPSLQPLKVGKMVGFGNLTQDSRGNIKAHVGNQEYAIVRKEHIDRLNSLRVELVDIFVKHFTTETPSSELFLLKKQIEEDIDVIIRKYMLFRTENKDEEANQILHQLVMSETYLSREGIPLRADVKNQIYSILFQGKST